MGMYTELIFGCSLKKEVPPEIITILQALVDNTASKMSNLPNHEFFEAERWPYIFTMSSYYFGINSSLRKMWLDVIDKQWHISTRSNIKNYNHEIEKFLDWIKPYIEFGSGEREMYAIVTYEESLPKIHYLRAD